MTRPPYHPDTLAAFVPPDDDAQPQRDRIQQHADRDSWLRARLDGIGASEVGAILGLNPRRGPWVVWHEKVNRIVKPELADPMAEWGHRHEPAIAQKFAEVCPDVRPDDIRDLGDYTMVWAEGVPIPLFCTPDRIAASRSVLMAHWEAGLEIKCAWYDNAKLWDTQIPLAYQAQLQTTMLCCGVSRGYFAVLLNGYAFRWYSAERNERFLEHAIRKLTRFWILVQSRTPPPADFSDATAKAIAAHYTKPKEQQIELPTDFELLDQERETLLVKAAEIDRRKAAIDNRLKAAIGDNTLGVLPSRQAGYSWRPTTTGRRTLRRTILRGETHE